MDNLENQAKAEALFQKIITSPTYSESTPNQYEKCLELNPRHVPALWNVGCYYDGDHDYAGNGSYWFEFRCENKEKAINCFTRIIQIDPKFSQAYYRLGNLYYQTNKEKALQYFLQYLNQNPSNYDIVARVGELYRRLNRNQQAIVYFRKCIQFDQKDQRALHGFARIYEGQGNFNEALQCLKKCHERNKKKPETYAHYGRIYHKMGNAKGAIHSYRKCKQLKYDHKQAKAYLDKHQKAYLDSQLAINTNRWH